MSTESFLKLLHFKDRLDEIKYDSILSELDFFEELLQKQTPSFKNTDAHDAMIDELDELRNIMENSKLDDLNKMFSSIIKRREGNYIKKGYTLYEEQFGNETWKGILKRHKHSPIPAETLHSVAGIIGKYSSWEYPGIEFCPGAGTFTRHLVALDPLYIVDDHPEILDRVHSQFNESYQRRMRLYPNLNGLPENQFGMVFSWGHFEQLPLDNIKEHLKKFFKLLRPGGVVVISYNNCLYKPSLELTARQTRAYNTSYYMEPLAYGCGFDDIKTTNFKPNFSLLECRKPGDLQSIRGGQTLGTLHKK